MVVSVFVFHPIACGELHVPLRGYTIGVGELRGVLWPCRGCWLRATRALVEVLVV